MTFAGFLALVGCEQRKPILSETEMKIIRRDNPGIAEHCLQKVRYGGYGSMWDSNDQCFIMMPQQRWKGLWARGFELSRFCPAPAKSCSYDTPGAAIWLTIGGAVSVPSDGGDRPCGRAWGNARTFAIDFLGRKTEKPGKYGHMGEALHEIIADRVIAISQIGQQRGCT